MADPVVTHDVERRRFEIDVEGHVGELEYRRRADRLVILHTRVPEELGGRGLAAVLVRAAIDHAVAEGLTVVPLCPYARAWLERHPEQAARVTIDWSKPAG